MSDRLFNRFCSVLDGLSLKPQQQIVIALGGGADSQTLLDCAMRYRSSHPHYRYLAVHLDHSFHPDSARWSDIIQQAAKHYGVDTHFEPLQVDRRARQSKEAVGRERRYQRLCELSDDDAIVLLGQHRNDQIETLLLQLNRGSGPKGLSAMGEVRDWHQQRRLVRPLLAISKAEIYDYAEQHQLTWIEDDTNYDTDIERNFLRHDVIPLLEARWPQFGDSVLRSARLCAEQQTVMEQLLDQQLMQQMIAHPLLGNGLPVDSLRHADEAMQRAMLRRWLELAGEGPVSLPSYEQLEQIRRQASEARADTRMSVQCAGYQVRCYQMALWWVVEREAAPNDAVVLHSGWQNLPAPWGKVWLPEEWTARGAVRLERGIVSGKWRHNRRKGRKTLSDWLKQAQVPSWLRPDCPVLVFENQWIWVPSVGWLSAADDPDDKKLLQGLPEPVWSGAAD